MTLSPLASIPIKLRERIYESLLTHTPSNDPTPTPASPICALLRLNRQIHDEVITFLRSQLLVLLKTNDKEFISRTLDTIWDSCAVPFVSQLRSRDLTTQKSPANAPIAMELEFYMFFSDREAYSHAAFLIPASSLQTMVDAQGSPSFYIWTMQAQLSINLRDTFSHARDEAQKRLLRPYVQGFLRPIFVGIEMKGVDDEMAVLLRKKLKGDYAAEGHLQKLQTLLHGAADGAKNDWEAAAGRFRMARRYGKVVWENHEECIATPSMPFDGIYHLWVLHSEICANLVQVLLNVAVGAPRATVPTGNKEDGHRDFVEARRAAEEAIEFLAPRPEWGRPETAGVDNVQTALRKNKAKISFKAHAACKGMGDVDAAVGYLREAMKYEPETRELLLKRIEGLKEEGARDEEIVQGVIKW